MKKRRKPLILLGFPAEFLAFPRWFEHPTYRLGGGRSIQLSYGNIFKIYSILVLNLLNVNRLCPKGGRYNIFLGGGCSILLSYGDVYEVLRWGPPQKVSAPRSLRRRTLYPAELRAQIKAYVL